MCLSDVNESLGNETCRVFGEKYGKENVLFVVCDVRSMDSVDQLWNEATNFFGTGLHVDLWVNNAGVMGENRDNREGHSEKHRLRPCEKTGRNNQWFLTG